MPKTNTMTLRVSDELKARLDRYAQLTGRSMSYVAATAVQEYLAWRIPQLERSRAGHPRSRRGEICLGRGGKSDLREVWRLSGWGERFGISTRLPPTLRATIPTRLGCWSRAFARRLTSSLLFPTLDAQVKHPTSASFSFTSVTWFPTASGQGTSKSCRCGTRPRIEEGIRVELPEWGRRVIAVLREPLESGGIHVSRAARQRTSPRRSVTGGSWELG